MGMVRNAFILMLCMNLFLYFFMPSDLNMGQDNLITQFVSVSDSGKVGISNNMSSTIPTSTSETSTSIGGGTLNFIDQFGMAWGFVRFVASLLFAPVLIAIMIPNIPTAVALLFILPNILILVFGIISFIKGYDF